MAKYVNSDESKWEEVDNIWGLPEDDHAEDANDLLEDSSNINLEDDVRNRQKVGSTKEEFFNDVKWWNISVHNLPPYNEKVYREEIDAMDMSIPRDEFDFKELQGTYCRLVSYFARLSEMRSTVNAHYETFNQAYKCLKQYSIGFFTGTAQAKEASAEHLVHKFFQYSIGPKRLLTHIDEAIRVVDFAATNMNRILREKEANNKINSVHQMEGQIHNFDKLSGAIRTRNKAYMDNDEGDDE